MTRFGQDDPRQQNIYGPGIAFGGDNKGIVNNNVLLDPKTEAMLAKMSETAPELAALLKKALRDGIISQDAAQALMLAARNINEDVANALLIAGRNINEDVASDLMVAGQNINEQVANKFVYVKNELSDTADQLDKALNSLRQTVGQLSSPQGRSDPGYQLGPAGTPRSADKWLLGCKLICGGLGAGLVVGAILMHYHLGIYAILPGVVGVLIALLPALLRIADARRGERDFP
jgi:hypothetical protein